MKNLLNCTATTTLIALAAVVGVQAVGAATISRTEYNDGKTRMSATYSADKTACNSLTSNARDVCREEAKAKEKQARAELEYSYTGKLKDQQNVAVVQANSRYDVAKERCDDKASNEKDVCVAEAKAARTKALADGKLSQKVGDAKTDAAADKREANYTVAVEKCDALAGDAKTTCINTAKAQAGKS